MGILSSSTQLILATVLFFNIVLAFVVYRNSPKSATNRSYVALSLVMSFWLVASFLSVNPETNLFWARLTIFFATLMSMFFFVFAYTVPAQNFGLRKRIAIPMLLGTFGVMGITLTSFVFEGVHIINQKPELIVKPGIASFAFLTTFFIIAAMVSIFLKMRRISAEEKKQLRLILWGIVIMIGFIIGTVMIPVVLFQNDFFVAFIPIYSLFFLGMTAYSIVKYHLFNIKVIVTEAFTVILWITLFAKAFVSENISQRIVDVLIFAIALIFGVLLIRSVRKEVEQREQLQKLNQTLREFLGFAAHDLKNPVALIKQLATLIYDKTYTDTKDIEETTKKIKTAADRAVRLIDDFLDLRTIEGGEVKYNFEEKNLVEFTRGVASDFAPFAEKKGIKFSFSSDTEEFKAQIDTTKIRQVIQNLLDNSLKFTSSGFIKIEMKDENKTVLITVSDSGLGMKKELLPVLFEQFHRDPAVGRKIQGTGLGLYIAKQFVTAHKGEIWAESDGEGKGSRFFVRLPRIQ